MVYCYFDFVSRFLLLSFRFVHFYSGKFKTNFKRRQTRDLIVDELLLIFSLEIIVIFRSFTSHSRSLSLSIESNRIGGGGGDKSVT